MKALSALAVVAALWIACGYGAHGYTLGTFTHDFPDQHHEPFATVWSYGGGPISLITAYTNDETGQHPFLAHGYTCQQRWDAFDHKDVLGKKYFVTWGLNEDCRAEDLK